jgi:hypothetical protein
MAGYIFRTFKRTKQYVRIASKPSQFFLFSAQNCLLIKAHYLSKSKLVCQKGPGDNEKKENRPR